MKIVQVINLAIKGVNLSTNKSNTLVIYSTNVPNLITQYLEVREDIHIESWDLFTDKGQSGNEGINAGAYLCEVMEIISDKNLE